MTINSRFKDYSLTLIILIFSLSATATVAYDLFINGPLAWHIKRPAVLHGGLEALVLTVVLIFSTVVNRKASLALGGLAIALYLRRHNAELCLIAGIVYLETLLAGGRLISRRWHATEDIHFMLGLCSWLLFCFALSALKLATPSILLASLVTIGLVILLFTKEKPATWLILKRGLSLPTLERALLSILAAWLCVLAARSANVLGHDSIWYLGQGDRLLSSEGSIFESLGLVSAVHYFPKLWETLLLPLTAFDQIRPQQGLGIAMLMAFLALSWRICRAWSVDTRWCCCIVLLIGSLPAVASSSLTLKTDLISGVFLLIMAIQIGLWFSTRKLDHLFYAFGAAILACSSKLIGIPYAGGAFCVLVLCELYRKAKNEPACLERPTPLGYIVLCLCILVGSIFLARTWLLTGVPTIGPDPLIALWSTLGLEIKEPVGTWNWTRPQDWSQIHKLFYEWLLAPNSMPIIRITWTGNLWAVFALTALTAGCIGMARKKPVHVNTFAFWSLAFTGLILAIAWQYFSRGGDGNYFLISATSATLLSGAALASYLDKAPITRKTVLGVTIITFLFHSLLSFISTAWSSPGTRVLDINFNQSPLQPGLWRETRLTKAGLSNINDYLKSRPSNERLISREFNQTAVLLPIRGEAFFSILVMRPEITETAHSFFDYADKYEINHLLLKKPKPEDEQLMALYRIAKQRNWNKLVDEGGILFSRP